VRQNVGRHVDTWLQQSFIAVRKEGSISETFSGRERFATKVFLLGRCFFSHVIWKLFDIFEDILRGKCELVVHCCPVYYAKRKEIKVCS
jgi:hypothetical protein